MKVFSFIRNWNSRKCPPQLWELNISIDCGKRNNLYHRAENALIVASQKFSLVKEVGRRGWRGQRTGEKVISCAVTNSVWWMWSLYQKCTHKIRLEKRNFLWHTGDVTCDLSQRTNNKILILFTMHRLRLLIISIIVWTNLAALIWASRYKTYKEYYTEHWHTDDFILSIWL